MLCLGIRSQTDREGIPQYDLATGWALYSDHRSERLADPEKSPTAGSHAGPKDSPSQPRRNDNSSEERCGGVSASQSHNHEKTADAL
jgi:hypothetical protein